MSKDVFTWMDGMVEWMDRTAESVFGEGTAKFSKSAYEFVSGQDVNRILVEVPGCGREDVKVSLAGRNVRVSWAGRRKGELEFRLPASSRLDAVSASVANGVLTVSVPKKASEPGAEERQIEVTG